MGGEVAGEVLEGFGVGDVFLFLDAGMEGFRGVGFKYGDGALDENGSSVGAFVDEMYSAAGYFDAVFQCLFPGCNAGKRGQQGWMDVENPIGEGGEHGGFNDAHKASQYQIVGLPFLQLADVGLFGFSIEAGFGVDYRYVQGGDLAFGGAAEDACILYVRDDTYYLGVELVGCDGIENGLAIGAVAGAEDGDAEVSGCGGRILDRKIGTERTGRLCGVWGLGFGVCFCHVVYHFWRMGIPAFTSSCLMPDTV